MAKTKPSKYSATLATAYLQAIRAGNTRTAAAGLIGVSPRSVGRWMERNAEFAEDVTKAEAFAEARHVQNISKAANAGTWTASAWWLERRRPKDWGRVDRLEITLRRQAERLAADLGVDADDLIREAERIAELAYNDG